MVGCSSIFPSAPQNNLRGVRHPANVDPSLVWCHASFWEVCISVSLLVTYTNTYIKEKNGMVDDKSAAGANFLNISTFFGLFYVTFVHEIYDFLWFAWDFMNFYVFFSFFQILWNFMIFYDLANLQLYRKVSQLDLAYIVVVYICRLVRWV